MVSEFVYQEHILLNGQRSCVLQCLIYFDYIYLYKSNTIIYEFIQ